MLRFATCLCATALAAGACAATSQAAAPVVRSAQLKAGRNVVRLTIRHRTRARPPLVRYAVAPAAARCLLRTADYHSVQRARRGPAAGSLRLVVRCHRAARLHLRFTGPIVRTKPLHDGPGSIRLRLDKPPGRVVPAISLETKPATRACRLLHTKVRTTAHRFALDGRFRCHGLPRHTLGRVVVGGIMAAHSARVASASTATATPTARASLSCHQTSEGLYANTTILHRTEKFCLRPTENLLIPSFNRPCPTGSSYVNDGQWPGFTATVSPQEGWWSSGNVLGAWGLDNWSLDMSRDVSIEWNCQLTAPVALEQPQLFGEAAPGWGYVCLPGQWSLLIANTIGYQWLRQRPDGSQVPIAGATEDTYRVTDSDVGARLVCRLTVSNAVGPTQVTLVAPSPVVGGAPRNTVAPSLTADELNSHKLTCHPGAWAQPGDFEPYHYEWLRDGALVPGEVGTTLRVPLNWTGSKVACRVTVTNLVGVGVATSPAITVSQSGGIVL